MSPKFLSILPLSLQPVYFRMLSVHSCVSAATFQADMSFCVEAPQPLMKEEVPRDPHWGLENIKQLLVHPSCYQHVNSCAVVPNHLLGPSQKTL